MDTHSLSVQHIFNRGVRKSDIFLDYDDYHRFFNLLRWYIKIDYPYSFYLKRVKEAKKHGVTAKNVYEVIKEAYSYSNPPVHVWAWVSMPNHFHLLVESENRSEISKFIHRISTAYAAYFNRKHAFTGRLFESSYKTVDISNEDQLMYVLRYIHRNPIKAGLIEENKIDDYGWSSWGDFRGIRKDGIVDIASLQKFGVRAKDVVGSILELQDGNKYSEFDNLLLD